MKPQPIPEAMLGSRPLRVLHCPWNIAGQSSQLASAERALGADSRSVVIEETAKGFSADEAMVQPHPTILQREKARWRLLWRAVGWADVVHFTFGQSCLVPNPYPARLDFSPTRMREWLWRLYCRVVWLKDLPLLSAMGKTIAVTWQGDDARQYDRSIELFEISIAKALSDSYYPTGSDEWKRRAIAAFARHAPIQYALNPDLMHVLPSQARFLPYASFDPSEIPVAAPLADANRPLVFVHAPSHRGVKGTEHVLAAAAALRAQGLSFELRLIEGLPRHEAIAKYAECDVLIDQLLAGWYGGVGVEAMALGKPVVAYLREGDLGAIPAEMRSGLPVLSATPATISEVMRKCIVMPRVELRSLGFASRNFAEFWHNPRSIAARTLSDYRRGGPGIPAR